MIMTNAVAVDNMNNLETEVQVKQASLSALETIRQFEIKQENVEDDCVSFSSDHPDMSMEIKMEIELEDHEVDTSFDFSDCQGLHWQEHGGFSDYSSNKPKPAEAFQLCKSAVQRRRCMADLVQTPHEFINNEPFEDSGKSNYFKSVKKCSVKLVRLPYQIFEEASVNTVILGDQILCKKNSKSHKFRNHRPVKSKNSPKNCYFECSNCCQYFLPKQNLNGRATVVCSDFRPYKCVRCGWKSKRCDNILRHINRIHKTDKYLNTYEYNPVLIENKTLSHPVHYFRFQSADMKTCQCSNWKTQCSKAKLFKCSLCTAEFAKNSNLNMHRRVVHRKEKPYHCSECNFRFGRKSHLAQHIRVVHKKLKPYECSECGSRFGRGENLTLHMKNVHQKVKIFPCALCGTGIRTKLSLHQHLLSVHNIPKPYIFLKSCSKETEWYTIV